MDSIPDNDSPDNELPPEPVSGSVLFHPLFRIGHELLEIAAHLEDEKFDNASKELVIHRYLEATGGGEKLRATIDEYGALYQSYCYDETTCDREIDRLTTRRDRVRAARKRLVDALQSFLQQAGIKKVQGDIFTFQRYANGGQKPIRVADWVRPRDLQPELQKVSARLAGPVWDRIVRDLLQTDPDLWRELTGTPAEPAIDYNIDMQAVRARLEFGDVIPGITLDERGEHVRLK